MKKVRSRNDLENVLKLQKEFPELNNGFSNGLSIREISKKIVNYEGKEHSFRNYSPSTVEKYVSRALEGFEYQNRYFPGLIEDYEFAQRKKQIKDKIGKKHLEEHQDYTNWSNDEKKFVLDLYSSGKSLSDIFKKHFLVEEYPIRTFDSLESIINTSIKEGKITNTQRIDWDGDVGFAAMSLIALHGKVENHLIEYSKTLDEFFYNGESKITKRKLDNFYKRNRKEVESYLNY